MKTRNYLPVFIILFFTGLFFIVSCDKKSEPTPTDPSDKEVWMENSKFNPLEKVVTKGTTITWVNKDSYDHNVTCDGWFASPNFGKNETYSFKFDSAGVYNYRCTLHLTMTAKIIVQ